MHTGLDFVEFYEGKSAVLTLVAVIARIPPSSPTD